MACSARTSCWVDGDDGTSPDIAKATVASHVEAGVHVIIGAGASEHLPRGAARRDRAGLILFSPSNTDAGLSTIDDKGLYFRTAPSDILQGRALADVILRDGADKIALVARKDSYGEGLQETRPQPSWSGPARFAHQVKLLTYEPPADADAPPVDFTTGAEEIKTVRRRRAS